MHGTMIHPTAEVQTLHVGKGTSIWQHCVVLAGARIGKKCNINCYVFVENDVVMGDDVTNKSGIYVPNIELENYNDSSNSHSK